jgi:hypothetical protein
MTITPEEYRDKILNAFPDEVLKAFMLGIGDAYRSATDHVKRHFSRETKRDVLGRVRRARVDETIRGVTERFADRYRVAVTNETNANGSCLFLCIRSGEIRLVCCLIATRRSMVKPSVIRKIWAKHNYSAQAGLFHDEPDNDKAFNKIEHLAVLVHAPVRRQKDEVDFVDIVIPDQRFREYNQRIELFEMFPNEADKYKERFKRRRSRDEGIA